MTTFTTDIIMVSFVTNTTAVSVVTVAAVVTINVLFTKGYRGYCGYVYVPEVFTVLTFPISLQPAASDAVFTHRHFLVLSAESSTGCVSA
jgi:hypothetical protein